MTQTVTTSRYTVTATLAEGMWELEVPGVGVTQAERVAEAEVMVRDLIDILTDEDATKAEIVFDWHFGDNIDKEIVEVARARAEAEEKTAIAAKATRQLVLRMKSSGLTGRDIAAVLQLSEQRVSQLLKGNVDTTFPSSNKKIIVVGGKSVRFNSNLGKLVRKKSAAKQAQDRVQQRVAEARNLKK